MWQYSISWYDLKDPVGQHILRLWCIMSNANEHVSKCLIYCVNDLPYKKEKEFWNNKTCCHLKNIVNELTECEWYEFA